MKTDMKFKRFVAVVVCALWCGSAFAQNQNAGAQTLSQEMSGLAGKLNKSLVAQKFTNVAAVDFTDLQGQPTELGRFLSEQITVEMVLNEGVSMLDRANIKSILAEHKLTEEGLVKPENAKKLGEFAGVDAILIGNVTALDDGIVLMVKAISTASAKIVSAGRITFAKTSEIQQLLNRGISSTARTAPATTTAADGASSYQNANAIATKDIGSLRVVLKSILPLNLDNGRMGIRCSFDFISLETQRPIVVALNATAPDRYKRSIIGDFLRSTLIDENGGLWNLHNSEVAGMSAVGVGAKGIYDADGFYQPTDIVALLKRKDDVGSDSGSYNDGFGNQKYQFIFGSTTEMSHGQSISVTMSFVHDANQTTSGAPPKVFQIASEVVVGVAAADGKKSYSLHNLTFDRVSIPRSP